MNVLVKIQTARQEKKEKTQFQHPKKGSASPAGHRALAGTGTLAAAATSGVAQPGLAVGVTHLGWLRVTKPLWGDKKKPHKEPGKEGLGVKPNLNLIGLKLIKT